MRLTLQTLALLVALSSPALAAPDLTGPLGQQLEDAVRHRAGLDERADVHVASVRISGADLAARGTHIKRVELPTGEDGLGRVAAKALIVNADGSEA